MILKEPEPDPNPTLFTTFYFSRGIKASISYHKIDAIILTVDSISCLVGIIASRVSCMIEKRKL